MRSRIVTNWALVRNRKTGVMEYVPQLKGK